MRLGVATTILVLVLRVVPLAQVVNRTREAAPGPLLLALGLASVASLLLALRLWLLARGLGLSPSLAAAAGVNLSALFYGLFLPGGNVTGGAIRFYRLAGSRQRITAAAGAIAWDRLSATLALCLVGFGCWFLAPQPRPSWPALAFAIGTMAILGIMALSLLPERGEAPGPASTAGNLPKLARIIRAVRRGLREATRLRLADHAAALGLSIAVQIVGTAVYWALAGSIGVHLAPFTIGWIRATVTLLLMLPITISGLGVREGTLMLLLTGQGVGQAQAVALGILVFGATVLAPALVGGVTEGIRLLHTRS